MDLALCFEITINEDSPLLAGLDNISVLSACLTFLSSRNELELTVGGLISKGRHDNEHLDWLERRLRPGDRIAIRIIESAEPSTPAARRREDPAVSEQREQEYYQQLKERYEQK